MMEKSERKKHWEKIYQTRLLENVSWYEPTPETSLNFIRQFDLAPDAKIIDVGGGDSLLTDHLLAMGYKDITVLDISDAAIERAKKRLGDRASMVKWIISDILDFTPLEVYDLWHDRATFHFLTEEKDIQTYTDLLQRAVRPDGFLVIGTFSEDGPEKCSGLEVKQYSEVTMAERLKRFFDKIKCITVDHITPAAKIQHFIFCSFRKYEIAN